MKRVVQRHLAQDVGRGTIGCREFPPLTQEIGQRETGLGRSNEHFVRRCNTYVDWKSRQIAPGQMGNINFARAEHHRYGLRDRTRIHTGRVTFGPTGRLVRAAYHLHGKNKTNKDKPEI